MEPSAREESVARFYDRVKFGLTTPTADSARFIGEHLLGQVGLKPADLHGKRVLEVGTGRGNWTSVLAAEAGEYQGVDLSPETVAFIKANYTPNIQVGNAKAIPFPDAAFDLAFGIGVLPAVEGDRQAFHEFARVVRPGGRFYALGYGRVQPRNLLRDLIYSMTRNWSTERKAKLCYHFTRLAGWPLPDSWSFRGDQLYAQEDWLYAPVQNRHSLAQLRRWCAEEGMTLERFIPYPHRHRMLLHEWAAHVPGIGSLLSPDYFMVARKVG